MKYMLNGGYRSHGLMRLTLLCTLLLLVGFWCTNALLYFRSMNLQPDTVVDYYRGSEEEFSMPRTYGAMLEVTHMHLAMMAMVILLLTHLAIFLPWSMRWRVVLVLVTFGSALLGEASGWLVRFVHPAFAWLKIVAFLGLQSGLAVLLVGMTLYLSRRPASPQELWTAKHSPPPAVLGTGRPRAHRSGALAQNAEDRAFGE